ncbi:MAG: exodeoxyribonuclease VII small subunit [Eubacteriales bacterium]|nr:exodeoxyribonuclease VII small subunit [Eubacteriales bacterium]
MSKELTFEKANKELEEIVAKMEKGDISLDESMKLYEQAYKLLTYCTQKLDECKGQIVDINERIEKMKSDNNSLFED